jgi:hypothetical protein
MIDVFIIPDGQQNAYYRQFGKLNRIEPIQLKTGEWCIPVRVNDMLQKTYVNLKNDKKRFDKRNDVTNSIVDHAEATKTELNLYPKRKISLDEVDDRYRAEVPKDTVLIRLVRGIRKLFS